MAEEEQNPCIQRCRDELPRSRNAQKKAEQMDCEELQQKLEELMDTEKKGRSGAKGLMQRYRDFLGDDTGHPQAYYEQQSALNSYLDEFIYKGCGDPPPNVLEWAVKPLPAPPATDEGQPLRNVAVAAGAVGAGYVAYRIIRFIPSLFFPPSIPLNLAVP